MQERITITARGVITLPRKMREAFGLKANDQLLIEDTPQGLQLRPTISVPVELYSDQRIREFGSHDFSITKALEDSKTRATV